MKKRDITKLVAAAAAVGTAAAAAAVLVKRGKNKKAAEEIKLLPKGRNIYFIGCSLSALFGAAYLIKDFGFNGDSIHIFGKYAVNGCGSNEEGFICYDNAVIAAGNSECLFDILKNVPSSEVGDISVKTEIENYNNAYPLSSTGRLYGADDDSLSGNDKKQLVRLFKNTPDAALMLGDIFSADFFNSDFYAMWQSVFALDKDTSAAEFGKLLKEMLLLSPSVESCEGILDTCFNKYESIYIPLYKYLKDCGVDFCENVTVTDIDFDEENKNIHSFHIIDKGTMKTFYLNKGDMCIMTPCTSYEGMTAGNFNEPAPEYQAETAPLWNKLYEKKDGLGRPNEISRSAAISFTVTLNSDALLTRIFDITLNSPGTVLTLKNSKWDISITCPMGKYFTEQNEDTYVITGRILNCGIEGDHVKKAAVNSSGSEILYEIICLLGLENEWEELRETVINVIPVLMPYAKSMLSVQNTAALSDMLPNSSDNFAVIGEFVKTDKAVGDMEYYAASARTAVYGLFKKKTDKKAGRLPLFTGLRISRRVR